MKVQMKPQIREAKQVDAMSVQHLEGGETRRALPGDWLIFNERGGLEEVLSSPAFEEKYEPFRFAEEEEADREGVPEGTEAELARLLAGDTPPPSPPTEPEE